MQKYLSDSNEINLRLPGPVPVPKEILEEQSKPLINHRGNDYKLLLDECTKNLKNIYATNNDLFIFTCSGTGVMEASVSNFLSENDEIIVASVGLVSCFGLQSLINIFILWPFCQSLFVWAIVLLLLKKRKPLTTRKRLSLRRILNRRSTIRTGGKLRPAGR